MGAQHAQGQLHSFTFERSLYGAGAYDIRLVHGCPLLQYDPSEPAADQPARYRYGLLDNQVRRASLAKVRELLRVATNVNTSDQEVESQLGPPSSAGTAAHQ
ncbi:hypothetical protein V4C56_13035 [Paraburkholderia azotifigens]|uniref:Uncharacterized protein n=1 Tax=Paraburkholderia azotifigens TaxID=2057004 RepID=A0ABU9R0N0_9BURK|nr:hypothetical protein [Paraburkholderia azotifigens]